MSAHLILDLPRQVIQQKGVEDHTYADYITEVQVFCRGVSRTLKYLQVHVSPRSATLMDKMEFCYTAGDSLILAN